MSSKGAWWWRSRKGQILIGVVILILIYYLIQPDAILDHDLTRRTSWLELKPLVEEKTNTIPLVNYEAVVKIKLAPVKSANGLLKRNDVRADVERRIQEALKEDKGTGCDIPKLDPFAKEVTVFDKTYDPIVCNKYHKDWVRCKFNKCRLTYTPTNAKDVKCTYRDIIYVSDDKHHFGPPTIVKGTNSYELRDSDHAEVACVASNGRSWKGLVIGFRSVEPKPSPPGREDTYNILILGFDSTSKNGFIRRMPKSYHVLKYELGAVVLNGYNIVGDGTPAALFPIFTGLTELELPEVRKRVNSKGHLDSFPFMWYTLANDGYHTAYFEDMPNVGTFQYRFTGFERQPADHYLRAFFLTYSKNYNSYNYAKNAYCVGDTPSYAIMMNLTKQYMHIDARKKFIFTFIADITHDDFNYISNADDKLVEWLQSVKSDGTLNNTLFLLMGDHGPRYANVRNTMQGKFEERLPLMSIVLPKSLTDRRPDALFNLRRNADVLTTPFDIHATLLDAVGLDQFRVDRRVAGSELPRSISLLDKVSPNRSCSEAGIEPHWCTCLKWKPVSSSDEMYSRVPSALVDFINQLTESERGKCVPRTLAATEWVMSRSANTQLLKFKKNADADGYLGQYDANVAVTKHYYTVKIVVDPGQGTYEASMVYDLKTKEFTITNRDISRINAYNDEPACVSATRPDLNMFCYCRNKI